MKLLSDANEYGLHAVVWMARHPGKTFKVREVSERIQAAPGYLIKVLQGLAKAGVLSARRGNHGGFSLQVDPADLTVLDVINAIDGFQRMAACPSALSPHSHRMCPVHCTLENAMDRIEDSFGQVSIAEIVQQIVSREVQFDRLLGLNRSAVEKPESSHTNRSKVM